MDCKNRVPNNIPNDISQRIDKMRQKGFRVTLPNTIEGFEHFIDLLYDMRSCLELPREFRMILAKSLQNNQNFYKKLKELKILELFGYESEVFDKDIEMTSINKAIEIIEENRTERKDSFKSANINNFIPELTEIEEDLENNLNIIQNVKVNERFQIVYGEYVQTISYSNYMMLNEIHRKPLVNSEDMHEYFHKLKSFIVQKIKMWGCNILSADNFSELLISHRNNPSNVDTKKKVSRRPNFNRVKDTQEVTVQRVNKRIIPFSRFDTLTGILNFSDYIVVHDILTNVAKFPISIPLIIKDLRFEETYKARKNLLTAIIFNFITKIYS